MRTSPFAAPGLCLYVSDSCVCGVGQVALPRSHEGGRHQAHRSFALTRSDQLLPKKNNFCDQLLLQHAWKSWSLAQPEPPQLAQGLRLGRPSLAPPRASLAASTRFTQPTTDHQCIPYFRKELNIFPTTYSTAVSAVSVCQYPKWKPPHVGVTHNTGSLSMRA